MSVLASHVAVLATTCSTSPSRKCPADCKLSSLKLDGNKAGDQAITVVLRAISRHQPPLSHLGLSDNRLTLKTVQAGPSATVLFWLENFATAFYSIRHAIPPIASILYP